MSTITARDGAEIFYKDMETGQPIMFHHGWPLIADDWDGRMLFFSKRGFRVIAHDRRGSPLHPDVFGQRDGHLRRRRGGPGGGARSS